ncbi:hypothetical protein SAMN02799636_01590 [Methylobacterium sp. 275MFSha3.1]|uniref:helix-turn-helix domain-containing protein n=1 Tax=Methylobacterium sp. 275MFSha3.1 TaxID=1502746 RepID=UPI0008A804BD|nr:helix-turn-helix transcriptional regulator [Methylobacterium sp. 275MFSha3.1]SEH34313.1 hypothetical protein SAMN02799636_01590 [Methylobacterium sp. 275MFSha3.1]
MVTGAQIRMARGYLRWSVKELAEASGVSSATIKRLELEDGVPARAFGSSLMKIREALEGRGLVLPPDDGNVVIARIRELEDPAAGS